MERIDIINRVGRDFLTSNIENGEFSYQQVIDEKLTGHYKLDIRFYDKKNKVAVLVETKKRFVIKKDKAQLFAYVSLEQKLSPQTKIIAILANTSNNNIKVWKISEYEEELDDKKLKSIAEYIEYFKPRNINDKTTVLENTAKLNRMLHDNGIPEKLRSQFVGTCLLALKENLVYSGLATAQINAGIKSILSSMLKDSIDRAVKLSALQQNVLECKSVEGMDAENYCKILNFIKNSILPYINDASYEGHDILSYFFTTFNKYVAREDKNQAFTPNHIAHFMCKVAGIHRNTRVLDPTCGSGTFLVQAMTQILHECETEAERRNVREEQIYGIEFDEGVYGLATTNMLIHGDGNSNIRYKSCFDLESWIINTNANLVLMNPPYNASKKQVPTDFANTWGKSSTDPSKGLYFVKYIADRIVKDNDNKNIIKQGIRLLVLLPMQCAIKTDGIIGNIRQELLEKHTLNAVFSFPAEMFYPGASPVACCMVFDLGKPHPKDYETFFGYYREDGFEKRKGVGRVDVKNKWSEIEKQWYDTYHRRLTIPGLSICKSITSSMEWCAEAYMETDYMQLSKEKFTTNLKEFSAYLLKNSGINDDVIFTSKSCNTSSIDLNIKSWKYVNVKKLFGNNIAKCKCSSATELLENGTDIAYVGAKKNENGLMRYVKYEEDLVTDGNCIVFIGDGQGSVGYSLYQPKDFIGSTTLVAGYSKRLNKYSAHFLVTVLDLERYRYSFGRKYNKNAIQNSQIKLPVDSDGNPDWDFMENYIKSLPYSANL